ncbi:MAG: dTMP kinase [Candidatus Margulisiibacteriota bacterium]|jgi:dTMP kinase
MSQLYYGESLPNVDISNHLGKLIVIEGADGSGRSTQIQKITHWLEQKGYYVVNVGIKRSTLVAEELSLAQESNNLTTTTMSLFYATDFADQLENKIIPALIAGAIVLCDRYIYTLMARDLVRGAKKEWLEELFGFALIPDMVFYLQTSPNILVERNLEKSNTLNYWESGMDLGISNFIFDSFIIYQKLITKEFLRMKHQYNFHIINGNRPIKTITKNIQAKLEHLLEVNHD